MAISDDLFLMPENFGYISQLYHTYITNPSALDKKWIMYFNDLAPVSQHLTETSANISHDDLRRSIGALMLIRAYRVRGHLEAELDPLKLERRLRHSELDPSHYGFTDEDYNSPIWLNNVLGKESATLEEIITYLKTIYCNHIGFEFMHIQEPKEKAWLQNHIEGGIPFEIDSSLILNQLLRAEEFERFLNVKFPGAKRFGLEGNETTINAMETIINDCAADGVKEIVIGMAHRGRLNVLTNILNKPLRILFAEFMGQMTLPDNYHGSGDVKYHMGYSSDRPDLGVHLSLTPNPSHLEAVNPIVLGKVRAKQDLMNDHLRKKVVSVLLHGDAAFAGQGLTAETLCLSGLKGYEVGGTIHIITNNQIGFTTSPPQSRSSPYSSDVAKGIQAPIFHVNGDYPEDVVKVTKLATAYQRTFGGDVVIDIIGYRRHGHNEGDEPSFTQPLMYKAIKKHPTIATIYSKQLVAEKKLSESEVSHQKKEILNTFQSEFESAKSLHANEKKLDWLGGNWKNFAQATPIKKKNTTKLEIAPITEVDFPSISQLQELGKKLTHLPPQLEAHPKIVKFLKERSESIESGKNINWATAESLAFSTLLVEDIPVRLSGQDSGRGTFSQRHTVIIDQSNEDRYVPLNHLGRAQASYHVIDSPLAEASVMGFDYGYSSANPHCLVIWEGQFGDFANGAQVIIDQFIASAEAKWLRLSGLVLLLPHGMEGQGPEHSSARLERFLQLCAEGNMQVVNLTTPANYYHALRRQVIGTWRKPLIVMAPKSLLRHKSAVSTLDAFVSPFQPIIDDNTKNPKRIIFCSGKVYYDLDAHRTQHNISNVNIVRIEQLYPFPTAEITAIVKKNPKSHFIWCQEETANNGAWSFAKNRLDLILTEHKADMPRVHYAGRPAAASPATGLPGHHEREQILLVEQALGIKPILPHEDIYG